MKRLMALTFGVALTGCTALSGRLPCQDDADCPQRVPSCSVGERVCTDAPQPDAPAPDVADPDVSEPDVFEPDVAEPDVDAPDAGLSDAGLSEAGVIVDGGAPLSDAGPVEDAGVIDDAGHIDDGGVVDGGHVDAGSPADAGTGSLPSPPAVAQLAGSTMGGTFCRLLIDGQLECWGGPPPRHQPAAPGRLRRGGGGDECRLPRRLRRSLPAVRLCLAHRRPHPSLLGP